MPPPKRAACWALDEGPGDRLHEPARGEPALDRARAALERGQGQARQCARGREGYRLDAVVAVDAQDILDEVGLARHVAAPGRGYCSKHPLTLHLIAEGTQYAHLLGRCHVDAAERAHAVLPERHRAPPFRQGARTHHLARLSAAELGDEVGRHFRTPEGRGRIEAALEAVARVGLDGELASAPRGADGIEERHLEEDVLRRRRAAARLPADDAAQGLDALRIGDHRDRRVERVALAVEGRHALARARQADGEIARELVGVEDVERAAQIEGHVIGDVDEGRDRPEADRTQALLEPARARPVLDLAESAPGHEGAGADGVGGQFDFPAERARKARADRSQPRIFLKPPAAGGRQVACDAAHAEAVRTVGGHRHVEHRIAEAEDLGEGQAQGGILRQLDDAGVLVRESHLALRDEHAVRFDAADHAALEVEPGAGDAAADGGEHALHAGARVGRPADDLDPCGTRIDDADLEPVGVGMGLGLDHDGSGEGGELLGTVVDALELETYVDERARELVQGRGSLEMILEPGEGQLHRLNPPTRLGTSKGTKP